MKDIKIGLIVLGIISLILGILVLTSPTGELGPMLTIIGILNIVAAIASAYIAYKTKFSELRSREILSAVLSAIVGLIFLFDKSASAVTVAFIFAFWIIFASAEAIMSAFWQVGISGLMRVLYVLIGLFGLYVGFVMLFDPALSLGSFVWFVGFFLVFDGIIAVVSAFMLPKDITEQV
ncbi:HdeD family acid-resistance protein [Floricoccus penangensis]|uniref:Acid-resistance membrane protein n=1 Tax=Floricoccus penangensis TaxID=1859475 RepID=A0A9Q5JGI3_9LACT|nr:DUF308 domain-containing protein [Floricoccus penangensis]OFI46890.1 hypothetical protein BG262_03615 [Floricoccus penangensis]URZ86604.1 DUF308 domain-containing protein [Floricoccus penangensis]